ncbi:MAG TPA: hypothetical protein VFS96_01320 [Nitrolancea sp.]|nr:hypothetical protein [Nitrolancea sp.]
MVRRAMESPGSTNLRYSAAALLILTGFLRALFPPDNLGQSWTFGLAMFLALFGAILLLRPWRYGESGELKDGEDTARIYYLVAAATTVLFILFDIITATVGIPVAGKASESTLTSPLFIVETILEVGTIGLLIALSLRKPVYVDLEVDEEGFE